MIVLVIPDTHLKPCIFRRAAQILRRGGIDCAVCLMDIADDWDRGFDTKIYADTWTIK